MSKRLGWFLAGGLLVALLLAGVVSNFASSSPDGLDATARDGCTFDANDEITGGTCMLQQEQGHQMADSPLADLHQTPELFVRLGWRNPLLEIYRIIRCL